jgi:hypothetical protein
MQNSSFNLRGSKATLNGTGRKFKGNDSLENTSYEEASRLNEKHPDII